MSTQVIESMKLLKEDLITFINDEILDLLDEFADEEIADKVISIASKLLSKDVITGYLDTQNGRCYYKVNNHLKGFVSLSDYDSTGVSRTEYKPFYKDEEDGYFSGLCSLATMLSEAYYLLNND